MIMNDILKKIKESNRIAITFHTSPDGDSLGTSLALLQGLRKKGKEVYILSKEEIPESFKFLPCSELIDGKNTKVSVDTECVIVLDCGDRKRINAELNLDDREYTLINIDHHMTNELYGDLNYVDTNASAMAEIVYQMLRIMGIEIDKDMAKCLYTSLITDTGSFKYSGTTSVTHTIAGDLINVGIDFSEIHRRVFDNKKIERIKLYGKAIEKLQLVNDKICILIITKEMLSELGVDEDTDTSDIINIGMQIDSVETTALIKEKDNGVKISLRAKSIVDVRKIAEKFDGGGHVRASGLAMENKTVEEAKTLIIKELEEALQ
ncbi:bifunctional oligoribonuclease/PAP phosphatase NrnA [Clostridium sp. A1-XYC3]|uniref:Bifunctional oligoribonuclease/PAP phosphatase NrnA n=1 Tax=Clostridium tanneri TaxID=3037988 RepID=A0ABU4JS95_9CLOT|nr:bifunctional oligoribonuclease/PAP phosphatase NrnA [Clostridium sp. A1-XYC3]MDW8801019.1 bifunctional oligoribonuclease/PAP phosphatase NrnA [Clostridium sp. A1-XYC3]